MLSHQGWLLKATKKQTHATTENFTQIGDKMIVKP